MKCAKMCLVVLLVQSLACLPQVRSATGEKQKAPPQERAMSTPAPLKTDGMPSPAENAAGSYKIGAGDQLEITVWKETALTGSYLVRPDGMISMPLLGDVQASALTPLQLAGELDVRLKEFMQNPNVTVQISQVHSKVIYLLGEVTKRGPIDLAPGMTLLQAISSAGGLTDYANAKKIYILRNDSGKQVKIAAHYKEALKGDSSDNLALQPGDTIVIP